MKITIENGKETVINLSGQLDTLTSIDLEKEIAPILQGEVQTVVLNGAELTYISSAGLRLLLMLQKGMKNKGGSFRLKNIQNDIMEILNITGFSHILEEAVTNVIQYAYPDKKDQDIRIDMSYENKRLTIVITDTGISFNPLERQEPDLTLSLEERPIGGLGIYLVKQLMTEVSYSRSAGKNILTMAKDIC